MAVLPKPSSSLETASETEHRPAMIIRALRLRHGELNGLYHCTALMLMECRPRRPAPAHTHIVESPLLARIDSIAQCRSRRTSRDSTVRRDGQRDHRPQHRRRSLCPAERPQSPRRPRLCLFPAQQKVHVRCRVDHWAALQAPRTPHETAVTARHYPRSADRCANTYRTCNESVESQQRTLHFRYSRRARSNSHHLSRCDCIAFAKGVQGRIRSGRTRWSHSFRGNSARTSACRCKGC